MNRRERFRRIIWILMVPIILLLLFGLRLIWGSIAQHRLDEQLGAAKNEPLTPAEMWPSTDPDPAHDAVPLLTQAMAAAVAVNRAGIDSPSQSNLTYAGYPPYPPAWHKLADAAMAAPGNRNALSLARRAREFHHFHWAVVAGGLPPSLNQARNLANLLGDAAIYAHLHGDDVEALARTRDGQHLADAVEAQHTIVSHLVAVGIRALVHDDLNIIAVGLKIPAGDRKSRIRQNIRTIISELLDNHRGPENLHRALVGERVYQIIWAQTLISEVWVIRPMYDLDMARMLKADQQLLRATTQPDLRAIKALLPPPPPRSSFGFASSSFGSGPRPSPTPPRFSRGLSTNMLLSLNRIVEIDMRSQMLDRMGAISLAVQLYRADHAGASPPSLQALVPAYLPSVPLDPLAPPGRPIGYLVLNHALPDGRDRPLLHSVGANEYDDYMNNHQKAPPRPNYGWEGFRGALDDQFLDLSQWAPTTQPATARSN